MCFISHQVLIPRAKDKLLEYARDGGRIVAFERAVSLFSAEKTTSLFKAIEKQKKERTAEEGKKKSDDPALLKNLKTREENHLTADQPAVSTVLNWIIHIHMYMVLEQNGLLLKDLMVCPTLKMEIILPILQKMSLFQVLPDQNL